MDIRNYFKKHKFSDSLNKDSSTSIEINNTELSGSGVDGLIENASITMNMKNNDVMW